MSDLRLPSVLNDLGQAGEAGLPLLETLGFLEELQLCRDWGFKLQNIHDRVHLIFDSDQLVPAWIQAETPAIAWEALRINGYLRLRSTNAAALELAMKGAPEGTLILAEDQTAGRGRKNRAWFSSRSAGLCCTLVLRPKQAQKYWPLLTLATSIALVDALTDLVARKIIPVRLDIDIKWPNDVMVSGRKCAGILVETLVNDALNPAAVVGFGINVRKDNVPGSLISDAVSLDEIAGVKVPRRHLLVKFLYYFQHCYLAFEQQKYHELVERWKNYSSMWNGVRVWIGEGERRHEAITCGLNEIGALLVRRQDGSLETVFAETIRISPEA